MEESMTTWQAIVYLFFVFNLGAAIGVGVVIGAVVFITKRVAKAGR